MKGLKLYVWEDILQDYTSGAAWALAKNVEQARELISPGHAERVAAHKREGFALRHLQSLDRDILNEPKVITEPAGFHVWGGG